MAYLSAWGIPAPLVRLDPLTASLRSEVVVFQSCLLLAMLLGLESGARRLAGRPITGRILFGVLLVVLVGLAAQALQGGYAGPFITLGAAVLMWLAHRFGYLSQRGLAAAFAAAALAGAYLNGHESGVLIRDNAVYQNEVVLATRSPLAGLPGEAIPGGGGWRYAGLYLVFRDGESVYVSLPGAGARVWLVPGLNVASLGVTAAPVR